MGIVGFLFKINGKDLKVYQFQIGIGSGIST